MTNKIIEFRAFVEGRVPLNIMKNNFFAYILSL